MKKKRIVLLIICLLVISAGWFWWRGRAKKEELKTAVIKKENLSKTVSASGKIKSEKEVTLKFQTSGKLAWVGVKEGDRVKQWQAIASLDQRELQKTLEKELMDYLNQRWNFSEDRDTYDITSDNLDRYTLSDPARRVLEKAQFDLNRDVLDVEIADISLKLATLVSPIDGIVTQIDTLVSGVNITPTTAQFVVADPSAVFFEADIDEADISQVQEGQKVTLVLDAYSDREITAEVKQISFRAKTSSGGGTVFPVKISLPANDQLEFRLGMNGDADIILEEKKEVLVAPVSSLLNQDGKNYVFVIRNRVLAKKEVEIGLSTEISAEIISGLEAGEKIVIEKVKSLKDGQQNY